MVPQQYLNTLLKSEHIWETNMGAWFPNERVVLRGKDVFKEFKNVPWMGMMLYAITGRFFHEPEIKLCERIWQFCLSYPDPRIWDNRIAALAGTVRSTGTLGISAAIAVTEAEIYGITPVVRCVEFLINVKKQLAEGKILNDVIKSELTKGKVFGYGRPIAVSDERVKPLTDMARDLGLGDGIHLKLAFETEKILIQKNPKLIMNIAAPIAAILADIGLMPDDAYFFMANGFSIGFTACYKDAIQHPPATFFPMRCSRLTYKGHARRQWTFS